MTPLHICTIIARNQTAQARVLARSHREQHPQDSCTVLVLDDPDGMIEQTKEPFEVLAPEQVGCREFEALAAIYPRADLTAIVKPRLLEHLLGRDGASVAYLDPDVRLYGSLDPLADAARDAGVALVPRSLHRGPGREPVEGYDLGLVALAPGPDADRLLRWWSDRDPATDPTWPGTPDDSGQEPTPVSLAADDERRFGDIHSVFPDVRDVDDPGIGPAVWNLDERPLAHDGERFTAGGAPLRAFNFRGLDPSQPFALVDGERTVRLADSPVLAELCDAYVAELRAQGLEHARAQPWRYRHLPDGTVVSAPLRQLYAAGRRAHAFRFSPFTEAGIEELIAFGREPAEIGARHGLTRLCLAIYRDRSDIWETFPQPEGDDGPRLLEWVVRHGLAETGLTPRWLPGVDVAREARPEESWGVNVAGYLRSELGIGEVARTVIDALDERDVPVLPIHGGLVPNSRRGHRFEFLDPSAAAFPVNLICVNADHFAHFLDDAGDAFAEGRYNIGFWWWEVPSFPDQSRDAVELVDEVWVGSEYVADILRPFSTAPVVTIPTPVRRPATLPLSRAQLGLPDGFLFLFMFDFHSVFARKNPLEVIDAFRTAFAPGEGASLVVKCINETSDPDNYERLCAAAGDHPDVHVIARYESAERKNTMLASCDCFVSLHRAEGFGLSLAEAMSVGRPVIATRYSGNLDYMSDDNAYLVDYGLTRVGEGNYPYPADATWAEPDREHAARLMREVFDAPAQAASRARQAERDIARTHSPDVAAAAMEDRLRTIGGRLREGTPLRHPVSSSRAGTAARLLSGVYEQEFQPALPAGPVKQALRRAAWRVVEPMLRPQQVRTQIAIESLAHELEAQATERQREARNAGERTARLLAALRRQDAEIARTRHELAVHRVEADLSQTADAR